MTFSCYCRGINHCLFLCDMSVKYLVHISIHLHINSWLTATWNSKDTKEFIGYPNINNIYQYLKMSSVCE